MWNSRRDHIIAVAVAELKAARSKRTQIDQDWVLRTLKKNVERAMQEAPALYEGGVAIKGLELIGEHLGMFGDRKEVNINLGWRFTIGKGYDELETRVVEGELSDV